MENSPIERELRKAAYDKADAHNSSAPLGVDSMSQTDTLYWRAADAVERLRGALTVIYTLNQGTSELAFIARVQSIAADALTAD